MIELVRRAVVISHDGLSTLVKRQGYSTPQKRQALEDVQGLLNKANATAGGTSPTGNGPSGASTPSTPPGGTPTNDPASPLPPSPAGSTPNPLPSVSASPTLNPAGAADARPATPAPGPTPAPNSTVLPVSAPLASATPAALPVAPFGPPVSGNTSLPISMVPGINNSLPTNSSINITAVPVPRPNITNPTSDNTTLPVTIDPGRNISAKPHHPSTPKEASKSTGRGIATATFKTVVIVVGVVGGLYFIWTIFRKWKFRPSRKFEKRLDDYDEDVFDPRPPSFAEKRHERYHHPSSMTEGASPSSEYQRGHGPYRPSSSVNGDVDYMGTARTHPQRPGDYGDLYYYPPDTSVLGDQEIIDGARGHGYPSVGPHDAVHPDEILGGRPSRPNLRQESGNGPPQVPLPVFESNLHRLSDAGLGVRPPTRPEFH